MRYSDMMADFQEMGMLNRQATEKLGLIAVILPLATGTENRRRRKSPLPRVAGYFSPAP
ncbi:hypothetical protein [Blastopirellula marina]|nr:hypothetical protein [Blastopirellula marina]